MKKVFLVFAVAATIVAFKEVPTKGGSVLKGQEANFQKGKAWTWVETDKNKKPVRVGVSINDAAMNTLDKGMPGMVGHDMSNPLNHLSLSFPKGIEGFPFIHAMVDWNPNGHEPAGMFDTPHFDFHFYTTTEAERKTIPPYEQDSVKFKNYPAPHYLPKNHIAEPGGIPQMGTHWLDLAADVLHGKPFTEVFIFGSFDGKVTFYEPMITKAFIDGHPTYVRPIPVPEKFQKSGYYPTQMRLQKEKGVTKIMLENFVYRQQS